MKTKKCQYCGKGFKIVSTPNRKTFCSRECKTAAYLQAAREKRAENISIKKCAWCEKEFVVKRCTMKFCCRSCSMKFDTNQRLLEKRKNRAPRNEICLHCGKKLEINPNAKIKKFCSVECRKNSYAQALKEKRVEKYPIKKCVWCGKEFVKNIYSKKFCCQKCLTKYNSNKKSIERQKNITKTTEICLHCGKEFEIDFSIKRKRFCSKECRRISYSKADKEKRAGNKIKKCVWCGKEYVRNSNIQLYCSKKCKNVADERIKKQVYYASKYEKKLVNTCLFCNKEFNTYTKGVKYCSKECLELGKAKKYQAKEQFLRVCEHCGIQFETHIAHKKYCSEKCKIVLDRQREKERNRAKRILYIRNCRHCGEEFITSHPRQKCCKMQCNYDFRAAQSRKPIEIKECKYCGNEFSTNRKNQIFCSLVCGKRASRTKEKLLKIYKTVNI